MNRDWYDTPEDERHPRPDVSGWNQLGQFEKVCWYVRETNDALASACTGTVDFDAIAGDPTRLMAQLTRLGIATYPVLAGEAIWNKINESRHSEFPGYESWTSAQKQTFASILGPFATGAHAAVENPEQSATAHAGPAPASASGEGRSVCALADVSIGRASTMKRDVGLDERKHQSPGFVAQSLRRGVNWLREKLPASTSRQKARFFRIVEKGGGNSLRLWSRGCQARLERTGLVVRCVEGVNANLVIGGSTWHQGGRGSGWEAHPGRWYRGEIGLQIDSAADAKLFCLMYDAAGSLIDKRQLCRLDRETSVHRFSFRTRAFASTFGLAIHVGAGTEPTLFRLERLLLQEVLS
jgi:hypothetical protein